MKLVGQADVVEQAAVVRAAGRAQAPAWVEGGGGAALGWRMGDVAVGGVELSGQHGASEDVRLWLVVFAVECVRDGP